MQLLHAFLAVMFANDVDWLKTILRILGALSGIVILLFLLAPNTINPPIAITSTATATVVRGEFYPSGKYDAMERPKVLIRLESGVELLIHQNVPINLKNGEKIKVIVWKRRFFGHRTVYERF